MGSVSRKIQPQSSGPLLPDGNIQIKGHHGSIQVEVPQDMNIAQHRARSISSAAPNNVVNSAQKDVYILSPDGKKSLLKKDTGAVATFSGKVSNNNGGHKGVLIRQEMNTDKVAPSDIRYSNEVEVLSTSDNSTDTRPLGLYKDSGSISTITSKDLQLMLERGLQNDTGDDIQVEIGPDNNVSIKIKQEKTQAKQERKIPIKKEKVWSINRTRKRKALYSIEPGVSSTEYLEKMRCAYDVDTIVTPSGHKFPFPTKFPGPDGKGRYKCPVEQCPFEFSTNDAKYFVENHLERHAKSFICQTPGA